MPDIKIHMVASKIYMVTFNCYWPFISIITKYCSYTGYHKMFGGTRGVVVIVVGNGHGDTSSNPGRD